VLAAGAPRRLLHVYGPTESTTFATWHPIASARPGEPVPIGRPIANTRAYVADHRLWPLPVGVPGELLLGGEGLAHGYLGRPELTAERFVPDPFGPAGGRLYRTGDLVRLRPSGEIEFLGRIDQQVKLRGFRIELGEIEAALNGLPGVATSAVMVREETGEKRLVAYVVGAPDASPAPNELREGLRGRLPEYMVPAVFVFLDALPLTPNGKVNRRALPAPEADPDAFGTEFVAPRTPLEEQIAEVWAAVLGMEKVGLDDTFWDLGGHSLLATRVLSRLYEALGVELPLQTLFEHPTLVDFAETVGQAILASGGEEVDRFLEELEGLSEEEIRELLREESLEPGP
jgi:acyl carrier protein